MNEDRNTRAKTQPGWRPPRLLKNKRTSIQEDPFSAKSSGMMQTDVLSCLMSAQEKEKHNFCMSTHEEHDKIAVTIDSGPSETRASVEKFESHPIHIATASGTTFSSAAGNQAEDIVNVGQRYIRVVDDHVTESWAKFQMWRGFGQEMILGSVSSLLNRDTRWCSETQTRTPTATGRSCGSATGPTALICG